MYHLKFMEQPVINSILLPDVTNDKMKNILLSLKNGAAGWDDIIPEILKMIHHSVNHPQVYMTNLSLQQGIFSKELKITNVLPLFKAYDPCVFNNYLPVSRLCIISKVYEKIIYNRLLTFFGDYNVLLENQFGFRKLHSPYVALMVLTDKLIKRIWTKCKTN